MTWLSYIEHFEKNYQMILLDHRGAGQSSAPKGPYSIEMMAEDTVRLLDLLNIEQASFVGSSMGTAVTQMIAYQYPERIDKGVLIAPFHKLPSASLLKISTTAKLMAAGVPIELIVETVIPWLFSRDFVAYPEKYKGKADEMTKNPYPQTAEGFLGQFAALQAFDSSPFLGNIEADFLLIAGEEDLSSPLWCAEYLKQHLKTSTLYPFPRVGHMAHVERRDQVISLIQKHVQASTS